MRIFVAYWLMAATGSGTAIDEAAERSPPQINPVRHTEDYRYLRGADTGGKQALFPWASVKYVPLNQQGDIYVTLGAELRLRYEVYEDNNWGAGPHDGNGYLWARTLPLADLHVGENFRFFGQLISAFAYDLDVPVSPVDENRLDVLQAFGELRMPLTTGDQADFTLRLGRQLLTYGSGRLIDFRYGPNVLQPFDAATAFLHSESWRLDAFVATPTDHRRGEFDDRMNRNQALWSLYATLTPKGAPTELDVYYIGYLNEEATFAQRTGRELRHTLGTRPFGKAGNWDWNFEFFYQFGEFDTAGDDGEVCAWSAASDTGYTFDSAPLQPRVALKANVISGDRDPTEPDVQTFNPLFPKGKYFGELSPIGPSNLIHVNPYVRLDLLKRLQLTGNVAFYWRESDDDGVYALGGLNLVRADGGSDSRYIGTQAELLLETQLDRHLSATVSYSVFTAGPFIEDTGADHPIHFVGLELLYRF